MATSSDNTLNLIMPRAWDELSDKQLRYVYNLIALDYTPTEVKTLCLFRFTKTKVLYHEGDIWKVMHKKHRYNVTAQQVAETIVHLDWLADIPSFPVRLARIGHAKPLPALFTDVPFKTYIIADNLYQGFLHTQSDELLDKLAAVLYKADRLTPSAAERISVFYWFASLKAMFSRMFRHFFQPAAEEPSNLLGSSQNIGDKVQEAMNAQIRALTHGDITKEEQVLAMDCMRALAELNAQAREYQEIKNQTK